MKKKRRISFKRIVRELELKGYNNAEKTIREFLRIIEEKAKQGYRVVIPNFASFELATRKGFKMGNGKTARPKVYLKCRMSQRLRNIPEEEVERDENSGNS
jgi:nucleoid DNA-binding protein